MKHAIQTVSITTCLLFLTACAGTPPTNLGFNDDTFAPCPNKPNCVSSFSNTEDHGIAAIEATNDATWSNLIQHLDSLPQATILMSEPNYIYVTFTSNLMGFVDDVEFYQNKNIIHVRSASRLGYSDLGVNRKRIESIRAAIK